MRDPTPLPAAEAEELGAITERTAAAVPGEAMPCEPGELKTVMLRASNTPMGGGVMRMMLSSMCEAQQKLDVGSRYFREDVRI